MSFSNETTAMLTAPLRKEHVGARKQGNMTVDYIEGWHAIAEANRIFGFGNWSRETVSTECVWAGKRKARDKEMDACTYTAKVRIQVYPEGSAIPVIREGCGAGHGMGRHPGDAHESALKEAETDAMKRALMTLGNQFGLALYDKSRKNVTSEKEAATGLSSTALQAKMREFAADLEKCEDTASVYGLLEGYKDTIAQLQRDAPNWWFGKEGSDNKGLKARVDERIVQLEGAM